MKIVMMGTGAMASLFGARMIRSGNEVFFLSSWREQAEAINSRGIAVECDSGNFHVAAKAYLDAAELKAALAGKADLVMIFCKAPQTDMTIRRAVALVGDTTIVLTLQNGVGNAEVISKYIPENQIFTGCASVASEMDGPGRIKDRTNRNRSPLVCMMPLDKVGDERCNLLQALFDKLGYPTLVDANVEKQIWTKLTVNCCANAVSAVTRLENCVYANDRDGFVLLNNICREITQVAQAKGIDLDYEEVRSYVHVTLHNQHHYTSMLQDVYHRRATEVETINGAVVQEGRRSGIATPVNETLTQLIRMISRNYEAMWI